MFQMDVRFLCVEISTMLELMGGGGLPDEVGHAGDVGGGGGEGGGHRRLQL